MFDKTETWQFSEPGAEQLFAACWSIWSGMGYQLSSTSGTSFAAQSAHPTLGFHRIAEVTVTPAAAGAMVNVRFRAGVSKGGVAGGAVAAIVFWPVAAVGGALSWSQFEDDWKASRSIFWNALVTTYRARSITGTMPAYVPPSNSPPPQYQPGTPAAPGAVGPGVPPPPPPPPDAAPR